MPDPTEEQPYERARDDVPFAVDNHQDDLDDERDR